MQASLYIATLFINLTGFEIFRNTDEVLYLKKENRCLHEVHHDSLAIHIILYLCTNY